MVVAALYDIHGNLPALDAVLTEIDLLGVDLVVVGGDVVWGPMPGETLDVLMGLDQETRFIRGNADREVLDGSEGTDWVAEVTRWCATRLTEGQRSFVSEWPETTSVEAPGPTLFCHGSPRRDDERITTATPDEEVEAMLAGVVSPLVVCGHTHMQFDRRVGGHRVVNAGSVGLPYEGARGAFWALIDEDVELRRTSYDFEAAAALVRDSGCPFAGDFAGHILEPPTREAALEAFGS